MPTISRRRFLQGSSVAVTIPLMSVSVPVLANEESLSNTGLTLDYPEKAVANAQQLPVNKAISFNYPDENSPCSVIRMGEPVAGGVGPEKDIVAFSTLCNHMGCPLVYDDKTRTFKCPCHFSTFDSEKSGQLVTGQATEDLPRIVLSYDNDSGEVHAVGVDGLIFGRQANI